MPIVIFVVGLADTAVMARGCRLDDVGAIVAEGREVEAAHSRVVEFGEGTWQEEGEGCA
ncbi:hypothetical protein [Nonomuraea solani]|uniref:hypothetical protein n=1 Tax=Nonomuraea solani TaxID=1144553 RepID=UPI00135778A3|nr:hypothetical protein [Nonomuraea solani]